MMIQIFFISVVLTALLTPIAGEAADIQQCSMVVNGEAEVVTFDMRLPDGAEVNISGLLVKPRGSGPHPAIVMLHGDGSLYTPYCLKFLAKQFVSWGFTTLIVASSTAHDSEGVRRFQYSFLDQAEHAVGAAAYLAADSDVDHRRIGVWGHSRGGLTTIHVATNPDSSDNPFSAAIAAAPHCPAQVETPKVPLLVIHGSEDALIPADICIDYAGALDGNDSFEFLLLAGGKHVYWLNKTHAEESADKMRAFLREHL